MVDLHKIRYEFPILLRSINKKPLVYFDNGATTQKPKKVIDAIHHYYTNQNANIHRGVHTLSREATDLFEEARKIVGQFINADAQEIVFTAGTTDSINLVASGLNLPQGSEIIVTQMEHHSNILPWQLWCENNNGQLKVLPIDKDGNLLIDHLEKLIGPKTKVLAITHVSNTLGVINPLQEIIKIAKFHNLIVLVDGAQAVPHIKIDVKEIGADFYAFSGHKMYGPTGTGVLWMHKKWLSKLKLSRSGGGTIKSVSFEATDYVEGVMRFEPGTPNIEGVIGLSAAIQFMNEIGIDAINKHEHTLLKYATDLLNEIPEVEIYANHSNKASVISFNVKGIHPYDVGVLLDKYGVAVRTGHHCNQPLMQFLGIPGTIRASFAIYNTVEEVNVFIEALIKSIKMLA